MRSGFVSPHCAPDEVKLAIPFLTTRGFPGGENQRSQCQRLLIGLPFFQILFGRGLHADRGTAATRQIDFQSGLVVYEKVLNLICHWIAFPMSIRSIGVERSHITAFWSDIVQRDV